MPNLNNYPSYVAPAVAMYTPANPTAPASTATTYKMQGLGSLITPVTAAGNILCQIEATLTDGATTVGEGIVLQMYYGPMVAGVAAPANAASVPASAIAIGNPIEWATGVTLTTAADLVQPVHITGLAKGLIAGQQYWFDLGAYSVIGASQVALTNVTVILTEHG